MRHEYERHLAALAPAGTPAAGAAPTTRVPPRPAEMSWRDYLTYLLHIAAEIEHALMVQYLYAAYSLGGEQVPRRHRAKVERWRNSLLTIAREEMGHLLSVQNVLCLIGGPISFGREDYPWDTPYYPFPFRLEPLTLKSLACYVYAEMPDTITAAPGGRLPKRYREFERKEKARIVAEVKKLATGGHPHQVAKIYDAVIELIADQARIPDSCFDASTLHRQASFDDWGRNYHPADRDVDAEGSLEQQANDRVPRVIVAQVVTRTQAVAALKDIAGQGEAPDLGVPNSEPSHFDRFLELYDDFEDVKGWDPTRQLPTNPTTGPGSSKNEQTRIEAPTSRLWANLFNLRYRMLLTYLSHSYRLAPVSARPQQPDLRGTVIHRAFGEMYNLKAIAAQLVEMPLGRRGDKRAGPTFEMPYTLSLPVEEIDCWRLHRDLVVASQLLGKDLIPSAKGDAVRYLAALADLDRQALDWIDRIIRGMSEKRHSA